MTEPITSHTTKIADRPPLPVLASFLFGPPQTTLDRGRVGVNLDGSYGKNNGTVKGASLSTLAFRTARCLSHGAHSYAVTRSTILFLTIPLLPLLPLLPFLDRHPHRAHVLHMRRQPWLPCQARQAFGRVKNTTTKATPTPNAVVLQWLRGSQPPPITTTPENWRGRLHNCVVLVP